MLERGTEMEHIASCQRNQQCLWMQQLGTITLSVARVSLALIITLVMVGFSLIVVGPGNVVHAASGNSLRQATRSTEPAGSSLAATTTLGLTANGASGLEGSSLSIELPLSTYGTGRGITLVLRNVTIVIKKLELELVCR